MMPGPSVCRAAVHPKYIKEEIFDRSVLFGFVQDKRIDARVSSVTSWQLSGSDEAVHVAGRSIAEIANDREETNLERNVGRDPEYVKRVFHYLGFYNLTSDKVVEVSSDYYRVELNWRPEDGSDAHFQIEIFENSKPPSKAEGRSDRNLIVTLLGDLLLGPVLCPVAADNPELKELQEETLPKQS